MELDDTDKKILKILQDDSRISYTELAKKLKISDVAVKKRIDKLLKQEIIQNFSINLNYQKLGKPLHAFLLIKCIPSEAEKVKNQLKEDKNILKICPTIGPFDLILEAVCEDIDTLKSLTEEGIGNIKGITEIRTMVIV